MKSPEGPRGSSLQGANCGIIGASGGISRTPHSAIRDGDRIDRVSRVYRGSFYPEELCDIDNARINTAMSENICEKNCDQCLEKKKAVPQPNSAGRSFPRRAGFSASTRLPQPN